MVQPTTIFVVTSGKGGPGKTTTAISIAALAHDRGLKVALLDLDHVARGARRWHQVATKRGSPYAAIFCGAHKHELFKDTVEDLLDSTGASVLVIDCPPAADRTTRTAAYFASVVLVPTRPSILDLAPLDDTFTAIRGANAARVRDGKRPAPTLVFFNDVDPRSAALGAGRAYLEGITERARSSMPVQIARSSIAHRTAYHSAIGAGESITTAQNEMSGALRSPRGAAEVTALFEEAMNAARSVT